MDSRRWNRLQSLFERASALPACEQRALLDAECGEDAALVEAVLELLEESRRTSGVLDSDLATVVEESLRDVPLDSVGPYRVIRELGRGGMGVVYLAERDDIGSRVAIKVLRDAGLSPLRRLQFLREERALAQLSHPSIARLYDADVLPDGTPYFVMEYVKGLPLTEYCGRNECSVAERLHLFREVCKAVLHAHSNALIHRDLKPSNILVADADHASEDGGRVKLLDFGIAKQIEQMDGGAHATQLRLMTPAYAAPEQIRGEPIGVFTDVYALGIILFELLTETLPFESSGLSPGEFEVRILGQEPRRPSELARQASRKGESVRLGQEATRRQWADLDVLCLTAMHRDLQCRYTSVEALVRDIDNFLEGRPLEARPVSVAHRAGKFIQRHRAPLAVAVAVTLVVISLVTFYTMQLADARDRAVAEAARTQHIQQFVVDLFEGGDAAGPADTLRVVTLLERGRHEVAVLDAEPAIQADLFETLGSIYQRLGHLSHADSLLDAAMVQRRELFGEDHPELARSLVALGLLRVEQAQFDEAEALMHSAVETKRRSLAPDHPDLAGAVAAYGSLLQRRGNYEEATEVLEEAVRLLAKQTDKRRELTGVLSTLANTHFYTGRYAESDSINQIILTMDRRLYGRRHPYVARTLVNLGATRFQLGYVHDAEQLYRQALEIYLAYHGEDHHLTASNMMMLAQALTVQDRHEEAEELLVPALQIRERVFGPENPRVATTLSELGTLAYKRDRLDVAEQYFSRMLEIYRNAYDGEHFHIGVAFSNLASVFRSRQEHDRAEDALRAAIFQFGSSLSEEHIQTAVGRVKLGRVLLEQNRYHDARTELVAGLEVLERQVNPSSYWMSEAKGDLARVYDALGDIETADAYRFRIVEAQDVSN